MRGEHGGWEAVDTVEMGSSPHARGAQLIELVEEQVVGIIPACAGSTMSSSRPRRRGRDHPRMRGEHAENDVMASMYWGSSPHARGARQDSLRREVAGGIIPACAGSTASRCRASPTTGDHPRMRGEHRRDGESWARSVGSSPHARGALGNPRAELSGVGIIPACAGSTLALRA